MISVKIQDVARKLNVNNAYQLQKLTGFPPGMAARIWKGNWKQVDLKTLNTLCNLFNCKPNDILDFVLDKEEL